METVEFTKGIERLTECEKKCNSAELRQFVDWATTLKGILVEYTFAIGLHMSRIKKEGLISDLVYYVFIKQLPEEVTEDLVKVDLSNISLEDDQKNLALELMKLEEMWSSGKIQRTELIPTATKAGALNVVIKNCKEMIMNKIEKLNNLSDEDKNLATEMLSFMIEYTDDILLTVGIE